MAITQTFTRTLPNPSTTHSGGFVFLLSTGWFTQADGVARGSPIDGGTYSLANGGGDLQAYSDEACTIRVPVEVVEFVTGGTPSAQVWVRLPTWAAGDKITIAKDDTQTVQPPVTDTYGRNAVYDGPTYQEGLGVDSFGTSDLSVNSTLDVSAKIGNGFDTNGSYQSRVITSDLNLFNSNYTISGWIDLEATQPNWFGLVTISDGTSEGQFSIQRDSGTNNLRVYHSGDKLPFTGFFSGLFGSGYRFLSFSYDGTAVSAYIDGVLSGTVSTSTSPNINDAAFELYLGASRDPVSSNAIFNSWSVIKQSTSANALLSQYTNQSDPDNFGTSSEWADFATGGISIDIDESGPSFTDAINTTLSANITSTITEGGPSFADAINVTLSSLTVQASIVESGPNFTESSSITITPSISINAAISEVGPSFTDDISALLSPNIVTAIAELGPSFVDSISISITKKIDINITEAGPSFVDNIIASIPITINLNPKKIIRVKRKSNTVRIKRKSNIIRVS